jgi:hypothetical protein
MSKHLPSRRIATSRHSLPALPPSRRFPRRQLPQPRRLTRNISIPALLFKDVCTQEWAMNSTNVSNKLSVVGRSCLTKDNAQDGVILFKDVCTQEWAMNTVEQAVAR